MEKKIKIRKVVKAWKHLPLEVTYLQVVNWVKTSNHTLS